MGPTTKVWLAAFTTSGVMASIWLLVITPVILSHKSYDEPEM